MGIVVGPPSPVKRGAPPPRILTGARDGPAKKSGVIAGLAQQVDLTVRNVGKRCRVTGRELVPGSSVKVVKPSTGYDMTKFK